MRSSHRIRGPAHRSPRVVWVAGGRGCCRAAADGVAVLRFIRVPPASLHFPKEAWYLSGHGHVLVPVHSWYPGPLPRSAFRASLAYSFGHARIAVTRVSMIPHDKMLREVVDRARSGEARRKVAQAWRALRNL